MENINNFLKNNYKKIIIVIMVIVFVSVVGSFLKNDNFIKTTEVKDINYIKIAGKILKVDLALTPEEREQGLSGRNKLNEDEGMLFVFDHIDKYSFWMKDMNFPIDIIWIGPASTQGGEDLSVVYIKKNALPESYPETFTPSQNAKYVLEVSSQFSEKNNLKEGDKVEFLSP